MATLRQRLHRKNASNTYDTVHLESSSDLILRPSGRTVEQDLTDYLPRVQNNDNVPETLHFTQALSKAFVNKKELSYSDHTHDDRYYTETEVTTKLNGKANTSHTHSISQVTDLQSEINSLKTSVSNGKSAVASAITDKGISTSATASFTTMANNIRRISSTTLPSAISNMMCSAFYIFGPNYSTRIASSDNISWFRYLDIGDTVEKMIIIPCLVYSGSDSVNGRYTYRAVNLNPDNWPDDFTTYSGTVRLINSYNTPYQLMSGWTGLRTRSGWTNAVANIFANVSTTHVSGKISVELGYRLTSGTINSNEVSGFPHCTMLCFKNWSKFYSMIR